MNLVTEFDLGQVVKVTPDADALGKSRRAEEPYIGTVVAMEVSGSAEEPIVLYRVRRRMGVPGRYPARCLSSVASFPAGALMVGDKIQVATAVQKGPYPLNPGTIRTVKDVAPNYIIAEADTGFTMGMPQAFDKATCIFTLVSRAADSFF